MDDSDRAASVISAEAGIHKSIKGLAIAASLLVLLGAGCGAAQTKQVKEVSAVDKLEMINGGGIKGLEKICDLANAKLLYADNVNFQAIDNKISVMKNTGWSLGKFCYLPDADPSVMLAFTKQQENKKQGTNETLMQASSYDNEKFIDSEVANTGMSTVDQNPVADIDAPDLAVKNQNAEFDIYLLNQDMNREWYTVYVFNNQNKALKYLAALEK
jgi:hypothetical protein